MSWGSWVDILFSSGASELMRSLVASVWGVSKLPTTGLSSFQSVNGLAENRNTRNTVLSIKIMTGWVKLHYWHSQSCNLIQKLLWSSESKPGYHIAPQFFRQSCLEYTCPDYLDRKLWSNMVARLRLRWSEQCLSVVAWLTVSMMQIYLTCHNFDK